MSIKVKTQALVRQRSSDSKEHAQWAGEALAGCVVARHLKLEKLSPANIETMRKRYHVAPQFVKTMLRAAKENIADEIIWQYAHS